MKRGIGVPENQGLYDSSYEKDNCGVGLVANIKGQKSLISFLKKSYKKKVWLYLKKEIME